MEKGIHVSNNDRSLKGSQRTTGGRLLSYDDFLSEPSKKYGQRSATTHKKTNNWGFEFDTKADALVLTAIDSHTFGFHPSKKKNVLKEGDEIIALEIDDQAVTLSDNIDKRTLQNMIEKCKTLIMYKKDGAYFHIYKKR